MMLTLRQASSYFDRTPFFDALTGEKLGMCQIDPYDDSKRDAMAAYRRIMSVAPGITPPRQLRALGSPWVVSARPEVDGLDEIHRWKFVVQMARAFYSVGSITQYLNNPDQPGTVAAYPAWVKDAKQTDERSEVSNLFEVIVPVGTSAPARSVIWSPDDDEVYFCLSSRRMASEFIGAQCQLLDEGVQTVEILGREFDPVQGRHVDGVLAQVPALALRWQSLFTYSDPTDERYVEGDFALALPIGTAVNRSSVISVDGQNHQVLDVSEDEDATVLHLREM